MKEFYLDKFQYTYDKNQEMIAYLCENKNTINDKIHTLMSHIINAHEIWITRILEIPTQFSVWQLHDFENMATIDLANFDSTKQILTTKDLNEKVAYKTSTGEFYTNVLEELLFHVVNHSTYHRAQINTELKNIGLEPLITDFVFYKRI